MTNERATKEQIDKALECTPWHSDREISEFRKILATEVCALRAENEAMRNALTRIGSVEAFDTSRAIQYPRDGELVARMDYATATLGSLEKK